MRNGIYKKKLDDLLAVCRKNLRTVNEDLIRRAFEFSLEAHKNDMRASGDPFFNHPYEVAMVVAKEIPLDDVSVASALLHDVAEDTDYEIKDIRQEFGDTIAEIVDGATKISDIFRSHEVTQAESYRKMLLSMVNDIRVMLLKFADRLHNMRTLEYLSREKQVRMAKETLDIYAPFAHRFGLAKIKWELEDLAFKYIHPAEYDEIAHKLKSRRKERETYIKKFIKPVEDRLRAEKMTFEIEGRPKHLYSIYNKMMNRNKQLDEIYDLFAVRVILDTENDNDCFTVYGIISSIYLPIPERFKNYISVPKKNGYQSIHATLVGPDGKMVEVQIRTRAMHEIAENGVAAHWRYKENITTLDEELENWISWVREIFEHADEERAALAHPQLGPHQQHDAAEADDEAGELARAETLAVTAQPFDTRHPERRHGHQHRRQPARQRLFGPDDATVAEPDEEQAQPRQRGACPAGQGACRASQRR